MAENTECQLNGHVFEVGAAEAGIRLDRFVTDRLQKSRSRVQRLIAKDSVRLNGKSAKSSESVMVGDQVSIAGEAAEPQRFHIVPVAMPLQILHEDNDVVVLVKPAGLVVHPGAGTKEPTLLHGLMHHLSQSSSFRFRDGFERPGIVHRLDKDTTGVMVCAKTEDAHTNLAQQFMTKETVSREYVALLDGEMAMPSFVHESYLRRDPLNRLRFISVNAAATLASHLSGVPRGYRYAKSQFFRDQVFGRRLTLARVRLFTGRTHQIRVHAAELRHGIVGDQLYHHKIELSQAYPEILRQKIRSLKRQMLHAQKLSFKHPTSGHSLSFEANLPEDFEEVVRLLNSYNRARGAEV